jgi:hypothetical protein
VRFHAGSIWAGPHFVALIARDHQDKGAAMSKAPALVALAEQLVKLPPTDADGIRLLQKMASELIAQVNNP